MHTARGYVTRCSCLVECQELTSGAVRGGQGRAGQLTRQRELLGRGLLSASFCKPDKIFWSFSPYYVVTLR